MANPDYSVWEDAPTVPEYYKGKTIFLTGFTGFMGKLIVEKMLWSCPDLKVIYVLIREKKGVPAEERLKQITDLPIFDRLRERGDAFMDKLVALEGDTTLPDLGLSKISKEVLMDVNIIFNAAASVRFDDPLHKAFDINTHSVKRLYDLALQMKRLECVLMVSTAYVNCHLKNGVPIEEKIYPAIVDWKQALRDSVKIDPRILSTLSYKYMNDMPNTYVFTKGVAEHIAAEYSNVIPTAIIRPTIVVMAMDEPIPGWIDNMNGPVALLIGYATGVVRTSLLNPDIKPDYIPVDIMNKIIVFTPWWMKYKKHPDNLQVFNCGSSNEKSISIDQMVSISRVMANKYPVKKALWTVSSHYTQSVTIFTLYSILFQLIPSILIDGILKLIGIKPMLQTIQIRINVAMMRLSYFTMNLFNFINDKMLMLSKFVKKEDFNEFYYYKDIVDEAMLFENGIQVGFDVLLHQKKDEHEFAAKKKKIIEIIDATIKMALYGYLLWNIYKYRLYISIPQAIFNAISYVILG